MKLSLKYPKGSFNVFSGGLLLANEIFCLFITGVAERLDETTPLGINPVDQPVTSVSSFAVELILR